MAAQCRTLGADIPTGTFGDGGTGGGGTATVDFSQADIQTDEQFACAFTALGDLAGWVFLTTEDNLGESSTAVSNDALKFVSTTGIVISPYVASAQGHTLGACVESSAARQFVELECVSSCDDVAGDLTDIRSFFTITLVELDENSAVVRTSLGTFEDKAMTTVYVPVAPFDCDALGGEVVGLEQHRVVLTDIDSWVRPAFTTAVTVITRAIGDPATPGTITDVDGTVSPLQLGSEDWGAEWASNSNTLAGGFRVDTAAGDLVTIIYTTLETN